MKFTVLCYHQEAVTSAWSEAEDAEVVGRLEAVHRRRAKEFGPILRLQPTPTAKTLKKAQNIVTDGPFAETKEQLLGVYVIDVADMDAAIEVARDLATANPGGAYEVRPLMLFYPDGEAAQVV